MKRAFWFAPGRVRVGLGIGDEFTRLDHVALGLPFPPFAERVRILEACCRALPAPLPGRNSHRANTGPPRSHTRIGRDQPAVNHHWWRKSRRHRGGNAACAGLEPLHAGAGRLREPRQGARGRRDSCRPGGATVEVGVSLREVPAGAIGSGLAGLFSRADGRYGWGRHAADPLDPSPEVGVAGRTLGRSPPPPPPMKALIRSIGRGKMMVRLWSELMSASVCR